MTCKECKNIGDELHKALMREERLETLNKVLKKQIYELQGEGQ
jgi:hypothetical protein